MTGRQDLFDESMRLGNSAAWELEWDKAIGYYRKALAEFPEHPVALSNLGLALLETSQDRDALGIYNRAAKASPEDPAPVEKCSEILERLGQIKESIELHEKAAELHIRRRDFDKALDSWNQIARLAPGNLAVRSRLALTYERMGRRRESVLEYIAVASILQKSGKPDRALDAVQRALSLIPGDPEANIALRTLRQEKSLPPPSQPRKATTPLSPGRVPAGTGVAQASIFETEPAEELADPEVAAQRTALGVLAGMLFEEPRDEPSPLAKGKKDGSTKATGRGNQYRFLSQAIDLQSHGHGQQAVKELERAIESGLELPAAHYNAGILYKELQDNESARKHLLAAVGHPDLALGANLALGRIARESGELPDAARHLLQALRLADSLSVETSQSGDLNRLYDTIQSSLSEGDEQALQRIIQSTLDFLTGPEWLQRLRKARQQIEKEAPGMGVVPIAEILAVGGSEQVIRSMGRIDEMLALNMPISAMEEAYLALQIAPTYLSLHHKMADILLQAEHTDAALAKLSAIAETHRVRGESRQAADVYAKILRHSPVDIPGRQRLIDLLVQQDRIEEALDQYLELVDFYRQMAQIDEARRSLAEAYDLAQRGSPDRNRSLKILHELADVDLSRLDWRRALASYEQIHALDPKDDKAAMQMIDLDLRLGQEEQAARELDNYLEQLVKSGRSAEALNLLEEMAREHPGKQALHARLAEAYRAAGRTADAISQYDALGEIQLDAGQARDAARTISIIISLGPPDLEGYRELLRNLESGQ
jgi:tetratricopeptide (TPR) repeat protein